MNCIRNIAIFVPSLERGGMERVASQLSFMFRDMGHSVYIIVSYYNRKNAYDFAGKLIECPFKINKAGKKEELLSYYYNSLMLREIKKKYKINFTVSVAQEANLINIISGTNDKKILTIHNCMSLREDLDGYAYSKKAMKLYNYAYRTVAVSDWCKNDLIENYGLKKKKVQTIYNPSTQKCHYVKKDKPIVLYVGRLDPVKQPWHLIKAFTKVKECVPDAQLWIAGNGSEQKNLKQLAIDMKIQTCISFLGYVKDIDYLYDKAKVFAMTSKSEAFPCVLVETLAHCIPIVISDIPGGAKECISKEIVDISEYPKDVEAGIITKNFGVSEPYSLKLTNEEIMLGNEISRLLLNDELYLSKVRSCEELLRRFDDKVIAKQWEGIIR